MTGKKYRVIYADPPWSFKVWSKATGTGRSAESHYPTMTPEELRALPVADLAADDAILFLWAVWPSLPEAIALGQAWGFEWKTLGFDWLKRTSTGRAWHMGLGYYTRANSESCFVFVRGNPQTKAPERAIGRPIRHMRRSRSVTTSKACVIMARGRGLKRRSMGVRQLIDGLGELPLFEPLIAPVARHSAKPHAAYERIESLFDGPYLELFARAAAPGWDAWGFDAPNPIAWPEVDRQYAERLHTWRQRAAAPAVDPGIAPGESPDAEANRSAP